MKAFRPDKPIAIQMLHTDLNALFDVVRSSYASDASKAYRSFYKARSFEYLGLRPSYAKDFKVLLPFLQRIHRGYL